ncbi:MAG: lysylphosphatidylglycerol synthase transmembrane domain-containing protein [Anaerolineae bacterium]
MKNIGKWLRISLGSLFSIVVIAWAVRSLDWPQVWRALLSVQMDWILLAVLSIGLTILVRGWRWGALLHPHPYRARHLFGALLIGQVVNGMVPARAGDMARAYIIGRTTGISKMRALGTVALEKLWDIFMLLLFTALLWWRFPLPDWLLGPAKGLAALTGLGVAALGVVLWQQARALRWATRFSRWLPHPLQDRLLRYSRNLLAGFKGLQSMRQIGLAGFWSLLTWGLGGLTNYLLFRAFDVPLSFFPAFLLLVVLQAGIVVPAMPGRIGVFEGICVVVLALFNVPYPVAFSYGLVLHLVVFLPPIVPAAALAWKLNLYRDRSFSLTGPGDPLAGQIQDTPSL